MWLHIGVDGGATHFKLESRACNNATFRIPDNRGAQPCEVSALQFGGSEAWCSALDAAFPFGSFLNTTLPLKKVRKRLLNGVDGNGASKEDVRISSDAGR